MTTKAKLILGLVAIFAAGLVVGGSVGFQLARSDAPKPPPQGRGDGRDHRRGDGDRDRDFVKMMCSKQQKDLELTEEQLTKIRPIYEQADAELKAVHAENFKQVRAIFRATEEKIKPFLTPEQIQKLEEKKREREERRKGSRDRSPDKPKC